MSDLLLKPIIELLGENFYIPYYQRGYRWKGKQIEDLLNDIWAFANTKNINEKEFYCLQPIVIKDKICEGKEQELQEWEVVDGQQRITTIYIIISYLAKEFLRVESLKEEYQEDLFTIRYETRGGSEDFLKNIKDDSTNVDYFHMSQAYKTIKNWFENDVNIKDRSDRDKFLRTILGKEDDDKSVKVIWYHVDHKENSLELFSRLNMGKIPLTNSELVKALFLSSSSFENLDDGERKKLEISIMWDEMEQRLNDLDFWAFISNEDQTSYQNKIEILFDMMSGKSKNEIDNLYTFLYFLNIYKDNSKSLWDLWLRIEQYFQTLQEWYKNKNLYHKIGYLITIDKKNDLKEMVEKSLNLRKDEFEKELDKSIKKSIDFEIEDLTYDQDYNKIGRLLLLFNIESIRNNDNVGEYYPFKFHKSIEWSIEHIHAQNSEGLDRNKKEQWLKWLEYHMSLIKEIIEGENNSKKIKKLSNLIDMVEGIDERRLTWEKFNAISKDIIKEFSESDNNIQQDTHGISNLALIGISENSALNNSVFEVKRRMIIDMDKKGKYIPICTRRVFLKYYDPKPSTGQYYFWSSDDRKDYLDEIKRVLSLNNYLKI